jgi:hypothetical protein
MKQKDGSSGNEDLSLNKTTLCCLCGGKRCPQRVGNPDFTVMVCSKCDVADPDLSMPNLD